VHYGPLRSLTWPNGGPIWAGDLTRLIVSRLCVFHRRLFVQAVARSEAQQSKDG
jgi:hypothetical protein